MEKIRPFSARKVYAIDLFCGAGGLTYGLQKAGVDVRVGVDIDPACEFPYKTNNSAFFLRKPIEQLHGEELQSYYRKNSLKLLAGCAPCQTFSSYNRKANQSDKRWWLLKQFARLVDELSPDFVTMENVPRLIDQNVFKSFVDHLEKSGFEVTYRVINCEDFGIPQHRNRLVLLASKHGSIELLKPNRFNQKKTVRDAIGALPRISAGDSYKNDHLHQCASLSAINLRRIQSSRQGGTWRDWPTNLVADCHRKTSGKTYSGVYGRMTWDEPAPTMTTQFFGFGNGRFGHPEQDRAISLREGAILQSFPPDYAFVPNDKPVLQKTIGRLIGNAVPVKLGEAIGKSIMAHAIKISKSPRS
jgi:DNA (cytosine-5)-methyltransferase 1